MSKHLDTLAALKAIAAGRTIPSPKYAALQRRGLIAVRGHGAGSKPYLTKAGLDALSDRGGSDAAA